MSTPQPAPDFKLALRDAEQRAESLYLSHCGVCPDCRSDRRTVVVACAHGRCTTCGGYAHLRVGRCPAGKF